MSSTKNRVGVVNIRKQFRKTKMCSYHQAGRCTFGAQCFYAHTPDELSDAPDLRKTKLCTAWQEGTCSKADCQFAHGAKDLRSTSAVYKTVQCQWFATGHCSLGMACRYAHGVQEDRSEATCIPCPQEGTKKKKQKKNKDKKEKAEVAPQIPIGPLNPEFLRGLEGNSDILSQIVALCSQISADPRAAPPPGLMMSPLLVPADAEGKFSPPPGLATPTTIASTNPSPLYLPTNPYSAFASPFFMPVDEDGKNMSPMQEINLPASWLSEHQEAA
jgi:hypothetical protein